jgi:hypothetical protein
VKEPIEEFRLISIRVLVWISREEVHTILTQKARDHVSIARKQNAPSHLSPNPRVHTKQKKEETYTRYGSKEAKKRIGVYSTRNISKRKSQDYSDFANARYVKVQQEPYENHSHQASQSSHLIQSQQQRQHSRQAQRHFKL